MAAYQRESPTLALYFPARKLRAHKTKLLGAAIGGCRVCALILFVVLYVHMSKERAYMCYMAILPS